MIIIGHLAVVGASADENRYYFTKMAEKRIGRAWIGLHDLFYEAQYNTVLDQEIDPNQHANWTILLISGNSYQQPDNGGGHNRAQNCISYFLGRYPGMDDFWCEEKLPYICQYYDF